MSLIWKSVDIDYSVAKQFKLQNRSLIPDSKVYYIVSKEKPSTDEGALILVSRQVTTQLVRPEEKLWFASETGGVFVYSYADLPKLVNYDIPTKHELLIVGDKPISVSVPAGATITFQNLSDTNAGVRLGASSEGQFMLSRYQLFSESVTSDDIVTFVPSKDGKTSQISYSITQSAVITQLSDEMQHRLDLMQANIDLVVENSVSQSDLDAIEAATYHNKWSESAFQQKVNVTDLVSPPFEGNVSVYRSNPIRETDVFEVMVDINATFNKDGVAVTERGVLTVKGSYRKMGSHSALNAYCNNPEISKIIDSILLESSNDLNDIRVVTKLNTAAISVSYTTAVKFEYSYFEVKDNGSYNADNITTYTFSIVNKDIVASDEKFTDSLVHFTNKNFNVNAYEHIFQVLSVTTGNVVDGDLNGTDYILTLSNSSDVTFRKINNSFSMIHTVSSDVNFHDINSIRTLDMFTTNFLNSKFLNLRYISKSKTFTTVNNMKVIKIELDTIGKSFKYLDDIMNHILANPIEKISITTFKEV
ncbi:MAG: hypothetical protein ACRCX2_36295 [Paraclostridium sp.]